MTKATIAIALSLMLLPGLAAAKRCNHGPASVQTMSCADGTLFDATTGTCLPIYVS